MSVFNNIEIDSVERKLTSKGKFVRILLYWINNPKANADIINRDLHLSKNNIEVHFYLHFIKSLSPFFISMFNDVNMNEPTSILQAIPDYLRYEGCLTDIRLFTRK